MQFEFRKRFSSGLAVQHQLHLEPARVSSSATAFTKPLEWIDQAGQVGNVRHAVKANWICRDAVRPGSPFGSDMNRRCSTRIVGGWSFDGVVRVQTGEVLDFGNVRLVGMTRTELQNAIRVQQGPSGQIFILPDDILQNTVKAFNVSATSPTGYGALGAPTGRYFAPANGPDCIETAPGYGDCGLRSVVVNGPRLVRFDLGIVKEFGIRGRFTFEFRGELLNAFNDPYLNPASTGGHAARHHERCTTDPGGPVAAAARRPRTPTAATNVDNYRLTALLGDNQSRIIQLVWRLRW